LSANGRELKTESDKMKFAQTQGITGDWRPAATIRNLRGRALLKKEADELMAIFVTIVRKTKAKTER